MKIGILTYTSLHCNFTNYGTVLQAWALQQTVKKLLRDSPDHSEDQVVLVNYCPGTMEGMNPLFPFDNMWDNDERLREQARKTLPAIKENLRKIEEFYAKRFNLTDKEYSEENLNCIVKEEGVSRFIVGSDSIWDIEEFGVDNGFFANHPVMRKKSIAYAPSFQDSIESFKKDEWELAKKMIRDNFRSVALRDRQAAEIIEKEEDIAYPVVVDPTLTLLPEEYGVIESTEKIPPKPYLLYYSRRYNEAAEKMVDEIAEARGLEVVEISLRAQNSDRHIMRYDAGVEEFLSLVKNAEVVVTNSFHCMIFAILYKRDFYVYSREHCYGKIVELLDTLGLSDRFVSDCNNFMNQKAIDYKKVFLELAELRSRAIRYLEDSISKLQ